MRKLLIFGASGFAEMAHYYFRLDSPREVVAFVVDGAYLRETTFQGLPVVPFEELVRSHPPADHRIFVALGIRRVNALRAGKLAEVEARGYRAVGFVSSRAVVPPGLRARPNTMIMEQARIHPYVEIGRDTVVWSDSRVAFRGRIGDHCWLASPLLGESVTVGDFSFIGLGATIAPGVTVGRSNVIGAGALIMTDTGDDQVYRGAASKPSRVPSHRLRGFGS